MAGALSEISQDTLRHEFRSIKTDTAQILLLDSVKRVLPPYPEVLSAKAEMALKRVGVQFHSETIVTGISADAITVKQVLAGAKTTQFLKLSDSCGLARRMGNP